MCMSSWTSRLPRGDVLSKRGTSDWNAGNGPVNLPRLFRIETPGLAKAPGVSSFDGP